MIKHLKRKITFEVFSLWVVFSACAVTAQNSQPTASLSHKDEFEMLSVNGDALLHCDDVVKITVYGEDDLTTETRIQRNGSIRFPLLGSVPLAGKTVDQGIQEIHDLLAKNYIRNPQVTLTISSYAKQRLTILGEVKNPGEIEFPDDGDLDLLGAVALAGGFTEIAEISHITVRRPVNGQVQIIEVDAKKLAHDSNAKPFLVQPGDTITVRQRMF